MTTFTAISLTLTMLIIFFTFRMNIAHKHFMKGSSILDSYLKPIYKRGFRSLGEIKATKEMIDLFFEGYGKDRRIFDLTKWSFDSFYPNMTDTFDSMLKEAASDGDKE